ncbi:MAG: nucleotide exchange factor GrpE [Bacteroidetes bacterium]|nr:nucleotide exchange factor GrpE [Bacteroidota bacterium]
MEMNDKNPASRNMGGKLKNLYNSYIRTEDIQGKQAMNDDTLELHHESNIDSTEHQNNDSSLHEKIIALEKERDEMREQALRRTAELENFRRRTIKEKQELTEYANQHLLFKMLPVIDDLHSALNAAQKNTDYQSLLEGVEMIYKKAVKIFEDSGVLVIESSLGEPFNVDVHEALAHLPSDTPEGHIIQEVQRGYLFRDKVLRHTKVITSAGQPE